MKERIVRAVAGTLVLTGVALAHFVNVNWLWLAVFVGANRHLPNFVRLSGYWATLA